MQDTRFVTGSKNILHNSPHSKSGDATVVHTTKVLAKNTSQSADGTILQTKGAASYHAYAEDLNRFTWYWGKISRSSCEAMLKAKGEVGNFIVRLNDRGVFIMSFWCVYIRVEIDVCCNICS